MPLKAPQLDLESVAEAVLNHLAQNPEQLVEFMGVSGLSPDGLRRAVGTTAFSRGLLDYVVQNEPLLLDICRAAGLSPESVTRLWTRLNPAG